MAELRSAPQPLEVLYNDYATRAQVGARCRAVGGGGGWATPSGCRFCGGLCLRPPPPPPPPAYFAALCGCLTLPLPRSRSFPPAELAAVPGDGARGALHRPALRQPAVGPGAAGGGRRRRRRGAEGPRGRRVQGGGEPLSPPCAGCRPLLVCRRYRHHAHAQAAAPPAPPAAHCTHTHAGLAAAVESRDARRRRRRRAACRGGGPGRSVPPG